MREVEVPYTIIVSGASLVITPTNQNVRPSVTVPAATATFTATPAAKYIVIVNDGSTNTWIAWDKCLNTNATSREAFITEMTGLAAAAATVNSFTTITATSGTIGNVSFSGGALTGVSSLGVDIPVWIPFGRSNIAGTASHAGPASSAGYDTAFTAQWGKTVTFDKLALGVDDFTGTFRVILYKNGVAVAIDGVNTFKDFVIGTLVDEQVVDIDSFTMVDGDSLYATVSQSAGTTGSEISGRVWGHFSI